MEDIRKFLESSTIHGMAHISTARTSVVKCIWVFVVLSGFIGAVALINKSFIDWSESPITTTIETLPIEKITFPKVTVCPPKNTYTELNYDLIMTESMTLTDEDKQTLSNLAMSLLLDHSNNRTMANLAAIQDEKRYHNWYHGFTKINLLPPINHRDCMNRPELSSVETYASSGSILTSNYGDNFSKDKVEPRTCIIIKLSPSRSTRNDTNAILHMKIDKKTMTDLSSIGADMMNLNDNDLSEKDNYIFNQTFPRNQALKLYRAVALEDIWSSEMKKLPGFNFTWHYSGNITEEPYFENNRTTLSFVRN